MPKDKAVMRKSKRTVNIFKLIRFVFIILICYFLAVKIPGLINPKLQPYSADANYPAAVEAESGEADSSAFLIPDFGIDFSNLFGWNQTPQENQAVTASKNLTPLRNKILKYLKGHTGRYGIYMIDLNSGQQMGINENRGFFAASAIKIPINLYLYYKAAINEISLDEELEFIEEDYEEGTGSVQYEDFGAVFPLRELSRRSIVESDNSATNMILRHIGLENVKAHMKQLGGRYFKYDRNVSSPKDMAIYMKAVYGFSNNYSELGSELLEHLKYTEFNDRIPALLPYEIEVAHKIGSWPGTINDVGIVYGKNPFILAVLSENVDEEAAPNVIANIAKMIYDFVQKD